MKNIYKLLLMVTLAGIHWGCGEDGLRSPLEGNGTAPGPVTNIHVENLAGKAKITYTVPEQQDLLYVKAVYTLATGRKMEVKSSYYNNWLLVEGFANEGEYDVQLFAVNRSETASEPVLVKIHPLESPIWDVFRNLEVSPAFSGVRLRTDNPERSDIAIQVMQLDEYGEWLTHPNSLYTSTDSIAYILRDAKLDTVDQTFAFTVRDRWLNYTDTLYANLKPLYEAALPKSNYVGMSNTPGDAPFNPSTSMSGMWDNNIMDWPRVYQTRNAHPGVHVITFDIGRLAKLSRIVIWDYPEYYSSGGFARTYYYLGNLKEFEIWGSDIPPVDESFDNWHLLGKYNATKPSGLPFGQQNNEDYQSANAGLSWDFEVTAPKARYLRIRSTKNWGGTSYMGIAEIQVYGDPR
ncbi:DUF4959 domain-containing protein [Sphingobacterium olei]|uniref:DUF4959 domain-containing protein n=1 Tax=Sphingobacterium olei TaxID=2571155 RepID=A0A4U0NZZ5_9SPHI|nr:DUF5000 domain-containing lipoprotein [Sphingobacterium olei]TJZ60497.1 DUF4959 domain-containing protein [Sphingobacterium olei]